MRRTTVQTAGKNRVAKKLTPKKLVLKHFPGAICSRDKYGLYEITHTKLLGFGPKERQAWADAARRLNNAIGGGTKP